MAAATVVGAKATERVFGDIRVKMVTVTWNNGDTFDTGFKVLKNIDFTPTTAANFGLTKSTVNAQQRITLVSGGSLTGDLMIVGFA